MNLLTKLKETHRLRERGKDEGKRHRVWEEHVHTAIFKIGSQQGPTA